MKKTFILIVLLSLFALCFWSGFKIGRKNCEVYKYNDVKFLYSNDNPLYLAEEARIFMHLLDLLKSKKYDEGLSFIDEKQAYYAKMAEDRVKIFSSLDNISALRNNLTIEEN